MRGKYRIRIYTHIHNHSGTHKQIGRYSDEVWGASIGSLASSSSLSLRCRGVWRRFLWFMSYI
jgi:hypothetical protein